MTNMNDYKGHRIILLVDDDVALMHKYHSWMSDLSWKYARLFHNSSSNKLYDRRVYLLKDLDSTLDSIKNSFYATNLDLVITDFDLIPGTGNDVARIVRAKFPDAKIVGNTGGDPSRFDKTLVNLAVDKIKDIDTLYSVIDRNTRLKLDSGCRNLFDVELTVGYDS